jgi:hypothetical protein
MSSLRAKRCNLSFVLLALASVSFADEHDALPCFDAAAWPEADQLFRGDPHWLGADSAFSIDLGNDRSLWLFGDTWIDVAGEGARQNARMIRNSVAIQSGNDPSQATIKFYWDNSGEQPRALFRREDDHWYWPGHGAVVNGKLIIFLNRLRASSAGLGFEADGWNTVLIENPAEPVSEWVVREIETPANPMGITPGFAGVLILGEHLYAFGSQHPVKSHPVFIARWTLDDVANGELMLPEWWAGGDYGWVANDSMPPRWPVFNGGQTEMTFHFDVVSGKFLAIQTAGFGAANVMVRYADELTGPWSQPQQIFEPVEKSRPNVLIYAGKAHPQLSGADLVLSYATNTTDFAEHFSDPDIYYPHFVRLTRCRKK